MGNAQEHVQLDLIFFSLNFEIKERVRAVLHPSINSKAGAAIGLCFGTETCSYYTPKGYIYVRPNSTSTQAIWVLLRQAGRQAWAASAPC